MWRKIVDVFFWISASLYFGGMVALGAIVAPGVFAATRKAGIVLPGIASPPLKGVDQAGGEIFGEILRRFTILEFSALGCILICLVVWLSTVRLFRRSTWIMTALWGILVATASYDAAILTPRVWDVRTTVRNEAAAHVDEGMDARWPAREEFDALHKRSELLGHVRVYALLAMVAIAAWRGPPRRRLRGAMLNEAMRTKR
jgi:hypothetical protein